MELQAGWRAGFSVEFNCEKPAIVEKFDAG
jgi:hypothetical protein